MEKKDLGKFNLKQSVSGGPLAILDNGNFDLDNLRSELAGEVQKKDLLVHVQYFPEEDKYGFAVYREKKRE